MRTHLLQTIKRAALVMLAVPALLLTTTAPVYAGQTGGGYGNNGTLKVHEIGTPSGTESNDPKVCAFNFEGFGFDRYESGYIMIDLQGGSSPVGVDAGPFAFGPTSYSGYAISQNFNNGGSSTTIVNGTYKATLYGKKANGQMNPYDQKAKSKVFKVNCPTTVTPAAVTFNDVCGTANDTYTIPQTTGVNYQKNNTTVSANTYAGAGTVTIKAVAQAGYVLSGTTTWTKTFTNVACPPTQVIATAPTNIDLTCDADGSYTIPQTTGVTYKVNNVVTVANTYPVDQAGTVTITAHANNGYALTGTTQWVFTFHEPADCTPPEVDVCPNIPDVQVQVPAGFVLNNDGNCVPTGGKGGGEPETPPSNPATPVVSLFTPATPVVKTVTVSSKPSTDQLVNTGSSLMLNLFVGLFILGATAALSIAGYQNRNKNRLSL